MSVTMDRSLSERVLDLAVYAPIGFAAHLRDQHEAYVAAGRERFGQTVEVARFVGKMAVERGQQELRKRLDRSSPTRTPPAPYAQPPGSSATTATSPGTAATAPSGSTTATSAPTPSSTASPAHVVAVAIVPDVAPPSADLPLADYDSLAASQVVLRLDDLQPDEVEAVRAYEAAHRGRRTILTKIAQLQGS